MNEKIIKNKLSLKLLFDTVMMILLALMYNKMAVNMTFHEIGGLFLFCMFILHMIFNYKWIIGVTKKLFFKFLPIKTRIGYMINFLLMISFVLVCISGIFISKVLFQFNSGMIWKTVHYTSAAAALILVGIHVGLHIKTISSFIKNKIILPAPAGKVIGVFCLTVLAAFGVYNMSTTSFIQWLSMPFSISAMPLSGDMPDRGEELQGREGVEPPADGRGQGQGQRHMNGKGQGDSPENAKMGGFSLSNVLLTIARFTSIAVVFTALTFGLELIIPHSLKPPPY